MYIREAHPIDGTSPGRNLIEQPITTLERLSVATTCVADLDLGGMPALLDGIDDATNHAYAAQPDRLYLVGNDGRIAYAGAQGPRGFKPEELEEAILHELGRGPAVAGSEPDSPPDRDPETPGGGFRPGGGGFRTAGAGGGPGGADLLRRIPLMTALDADQDGEISAEELENAVAALKGLDSDENGKLTEDELRPKFGDRGGSGGGRSGFSGSRGSGGFGGGRPARPQPDE